MNEINLYGIYDADYSVSSVAVYGVETPAGRRHLRQMNNERRKHGLVYHLCGSFQYICDNYSVSAGENEVVYLPKHSKYHHVSCGLPGCICRTVVINFNLRIGGEEVSLGGDIIKLGEIDGNSLAHNFTGLLEIYRGKSNPARINIHLTELLDRIGEKYRSLRMRDKRFSSIRPAVEYIGNGPGRNCTVSDLARMCRMSENAFRIIFKEYYNMTPSQMLADMQIWQAKRLLRESDLAVYEIAEKLGFPDVSYFCKMFKRHTGLPPGKYR